MKLVVYASCVLTVKLRRFILKKISIAERDHLFAKGYNAICDIIYPPLPKETQDARRKEEISYLRIYDLCRVFKVK
jgi:hypothetical protein